MSDFIREVDEEVRQDRLRTVVTRYWYVLAALAAAILAGIGAWQGYDYLTTQKAEQASGQYLAALDLARDGKSAEAIDALGKVEAMGHAGYGLLARMRIASETGAKDPAAGASQFDAIGADPAVDPSIQWIARLRAGLLLVDKVPYAELKPRFDALADANSPVRNPAREIIALAALKAGKTEEASRLLDAIDADPTASTQLRQRAGALFGLVHGAGELPPRPAPPAAAQPAPAAPAPAVPSLTMSPSMPSLSSVPDAPPAADIAPPAPAPAPAASSPVPPQAAPDAPAALDSAPPAPAPVPAPDALVAPVATPPAPAPAASSPVRTQPAPDVPAAVDSAPPAAAPVPASNTRVAPVATSPAPAASSPISPQLAPDVPAAVDSAPPAPKPGPTLDVPAAPATTPPAPAPAASSPLPTQPAHDAPPATDSAPPAPAPVPAPNVPPPPATSVPSPIDGSAK